MIPKAEQVTEAKIESKNLVAPRLKPEDIERKIVGCDYSVLPSGKVMVAEVTLKNGFTVRGEASAVSKANFNHEIGRDVSYSKAFANVWPFEGYLLQELVYWTHDRGAMAYGPLLHGSPNMMELNADLFVEGCVAMVIMDDNRMRMMKKIDLALFVQEHQSDLLFPIKYFIVLNRP